MNARTKSFLNPNWLGREEHSNKCEIKLVQNCIECKQIISK